MIICLEEGKEYLIFFDPSRIKIRDLMNLPPTDINCFFIPCKDGDPKMTLIESREKIQEWLEGIENESKN